LSRNSDRLMGGGGATEQQDTTPPQQVTQQNTNDFSFVVPTEFVELPSGGALYPAGHPLCGQETIEIKQMTAKEEDMLTSRSLLKKGVALERVISSIITNKSIDPETLLVGDRNAIIIAARISAYGSEYATQVTCPNCTTQQEYSFNLSDIEFVDTSSADNEFDGLVDLQEDGTYTVRLPRSELLVGFKVLTGKDEKDMATGLELDKKTKGSYEKGVTRQLKNILVSVNGNTTSEAINYVVDNLPSLDARYLRQAYRATVPNIDMTQDFECINCGFESALEVPLTADFFWPDR
jgi:hypothetical protein